MNQLRHYKDIESSLNTMKDKVIDTIISIFTFFYIPLIISSLLRISYIGLKPIIIVNIATFPILIVLYIYKKKLKMMTKIIVVNALFLMISLAGYASIGFFSSVNAFFLFCVAVVSILLGLKAGYLNLIIITCIVFISFIGFKMSILNNDVNLNLLLTKDIFWLGHFIPIFMVSFIIICCIGKMNECIVKIITEAKEQNAELLYSRNNYKKLLEFLPDAVILKHKREIIYANTAALKLFKANDEQEVLGKTSLDLTHTDYFNVVEEILEKQKNGENLDEFVDCKLVALDGEIIEVELRHIVLEPKEDQMYLTVLQDVSERKKSENAKKLLKEAIESEKLRTEFFANISHELRTPVSVISGALQVMEAVSNDVSTKKYFTVIKQNCYRLIRLINNLIDTTKIDVGFLKLNVSCNNIVAEVKELALSVKDFVESNGMTLVFESEIEGKYLDYDPDAIERIILNLISNSVKFRHENGTIWVRIFDKDDKIRISIKDDGIGIPAQEQEFVFERFKKVDRSFARNTEGSGIGLSIVKSLVELHNGTIDLISEEGKGTEISIELPVIRNKQDCPIKFVKRSPSNISQKVNIEFSDIYTAS